MTEKLAYRIDEAATAMGLSRRTLERRIETGKLPSVKDGRAVLIPASAVHSVLSLAVVAPQTNVAQSSKSARRLSSASERR